MIDYYDHIDDYVNGLLNGAELDAFEAAMAEDSELAKAVANHDVAMDVIGSLMEDEVRGVIGEVEGEEVSSYLQSRSSKFNLIKKRTWKYSLAAASIIGLIVVSTILVQKNKRDILYTQRFQEIENTYEKPVYYIERGGEKTDPLEKAITYFNQRKYKLAKDQLTSLDLTNYDNNEVHFYLAHSHFKLKNFSKSFEHIEKIENTSEWQTRSQNLQAVLNYILNLK
jgi:hypothetical protein